MEGFILDGQFGENDIVHVTANADNLVFRDNILRNGARDGMDIGTNTVSALPSNFLDNVLVENCEIYNMLWWNNGQRSEANGIVAGGVRNFTISNSKIFQVSGDSLQLQDGGWDNVIVKNVDFYNEALPQNLAGFTKGVNPGENAIDTKQDGRLPYRGTVLINNSRFFGWKSNLVTNTAALNLKEKVSAIVHGNIFYDNEIALRLRGGENDTGAYVQVKNNIFHNNVKTIRYEDNIKNLHIYHNTFGSANLEIFQSAGGADPGTLEVLNNLFVGSLKPKEAAHISNLAVDETNFVDAKNHNYQLQESSSAINSGVYIDNVSLDHLNSSRSIPYDVGAFEYPGTGIIHRCGDGNIDLGEQCDDGNTKNEDGCSSDCIVELGGNGRVQNGLVLLYDFHEGSGTTVHDVSGVIPVVDLEINDSSAISWIESGINIHSNAVIKSNIVPVEFYELLQETNEITVEAWIKPENDTQSGPARIVTFSQSPSLRNFTLGQESNNYMMRLRSTLTDKNGLPPLITTDNAANTHSTHVVFTREASGRRILYINGNQSVASDLGGNFSQWDVGSRIALANEISMDRSWLGEMHLVAVYKTALTQKEVELNFEAGSNPIPSRAPTAKFTATPMLGVTPLLVNFNAEASSDPDGSIVTYTWDFGNGFGATSARPLSHTFTKAGSFIVTLTVTDNNGNTNSTSLTINTRNPNLPPTGSPININTDQGQAVDITLAYDDPDNGPGPFSISMNTLPEHGVLTGTGTARTYVPEAEFEGLDSFSWIVNDGELDSTPVVVSIIVEAPNPVIISNCPSDITKSTLDNLCDTSVTWIEPVVLGKVDAVSMTSTHNPGEMFSVGMTTVEYTAEDDFGNKDTCSFQINILPSKEPVITNCPTDITVLNDVGRAGAIVRWTPPSITQACSDLAINSSHEPGDLFSLGMTNVEYGVQGNNASTCSFFINVNFKLELETGWNSISFPKKPMLNIEELFGDSVSGHIWNWDSREYRKVETIEPQVGYWVFSVKEQSIVITEFKEISFKNEMELDTGWNFMGPQDILHEPYNNFINAMIWYWHKGKFQELQRPNGYLEIGKGYWIHGS